MLSVLVGMSIFNMVYFAMVFTGFDDEPEGQKEER